DDRLHQPYRLPLIPGAEQAFRAARSVGATAVALSGAGPSLLAVADNPQQAADIAAAMQSAFAQGMKEYGTAVGLSFYNQIGDLTTNNLTTNTFPFAGDIDGVAIRTRRETTVKPCYKCPLNHVHWINLPSEKHGMTKFEDPEFEGMAGFGSNLGVTDMDEIFYLNHLADDYGMNLKALAFVISLAMECYEKGLLTQEQLGGLDLKFGNSEAAAQLIQMIGRHEGIGVLFGENLRTIAETIGGDAVNMVVEINGGGIQVHDLRSLWGFMLASAVSDFSETFNGLNMNLFPLPEIGFDTIPDPGKRDNQAIPNAKTVPQALLQDVFVICGFPGPTNGIPTKLMVDTLSAVTGVEYSMEEFNKAMYRIVNLARAFNIRHGLTPENNMPSERLLSAPVDGAAKGRTVKPYIKGMINEYYRAMGWDEKTSKPLRSTLKELDLDFVSKDLWG
ncbi:MAG: aldehyde ferredoxin oxidoreductase C-terminal domain-containing protein, partial [Anaerolineaceae bacterium]